MGYVNESDRFNTDLPDLCIPGVTKYLPRGLHYGSEHVIHGLLCLKCRKFNT